MNVMHSFMTHFQAAEVDIVADEETGFATTFGDDPANYWVLYVKGVAYMVWTHGVTGEILLSWQMLKEAA